MRFRCYMAHELDDALWSRFCEFRDQDPTKDSPLFDPSLVKIIAKVRPDIRLGVAFDNDEPIGFWPMHIRPGHWARPLCSPFSDWQSPILKDGTKLTERAFLEGLGVGGMTMQGLKPRLTSSDYSDLERGEAHIAVQMDGSSRFIEDQSDAFPKHFKKMRRVTRKLEREYDSWEFRLDDRSDDSLDWLITKKREQFHRTGRHDVLGAEWSRAFLDAAWREPSSTFRLNLSTLWIDNQIAAAELNMCSPTVMHGWLVAYETEYKNLAPGLLILHLILSNLDQLGVTSYDLGAGASHYKRFYSNFSMPIYSGVLRTRRRTVTVQRLLRTTWRYAETSMPARLKGVMGKVRRRSDQILATELSAAARVKGYLNAISSQ